ncbi:CLUMA_CG007520, isoform A [Clunio marinus]|uniref:CLUMA_CG007520, isoform A n=1 Tax=Clunio marinus TaxID=568069 RepID=A0A1J1I2K1_9DIPT|nr:CLUMA_CG007520, isoform A [Clunio marinus]
MKFVRFFNVCLLASCLLLLCLKESHSQLTFTPSWGKRSLTQTGQTMFNDATNLNPPQSITCNPKMDSMLLIYRLIQNEAQKMLECNSQQK